MARSEVSPVPTGYHTITPYVSVRDAAGWMAFALKLFGAEQLERIDRPDGMIMHAELRIGDSPLMLSDACAEMGPTPAHLYVYVDDVDAMHDAAVAAGATSVMPPMDMFWGDRFASVRDAWGVTWSLAKHVEDVPADEIARRARAFGEQAGQG